MNQVMFKFDRVSLRLSPDQLPVSPGPVRIAQFAPDSTGDAAANLELSKRRAASVKAALAGMGVAADRLAAEGLGDTKPAAKNDTPQGRAENRRVEFVKL